MSGWAICDSRVAPSGLVAIAVETLLPRDALDFDLYLWPSADSAPVLFREANYPLDETDLERLLSQGVHTLYIPAGKCRSYQEYLRKGVLRNPRLRPTQRFALLKKANRAIFESAFRSGVPRRMIEFAEEFGRQLWEVVCDREMVLSHLFAVMDHDYLTYTHLTNVCTYSVALAHWLGITRPGEIGAIAGGALLHDYGKRYVPPAILNKRDRLTPSEREIIRQHVVAGFAAFCSQEDIHWGQLMMIYQHHERLNGRGYPVGLVGEEIHPWAKICAIADVFDALTSARPYRPPDPLDHVLEYLQQRAGSDFDAEMVRCWVAKICPTN
ncbi:MAG: HD domain-containing protein [Thermoguttaceae bacterium]|nr:HD domain-containing protein [Thermoguttaceae bacterium]MDW8037444.1 HD domain-containing phosphohydrolase [Thermoguttaceae bacterium]